MLVRADILGLDYIHVLMARIGRAVKMKGDSSFGSYRAWNRDIGSKP